VTPAGEVTTSTAKMPATAGTAWQSYKSSRKGTQKCDCEYECGSEKKKHWYPKSRKVPKWQWFLLGVAMKICRDLATLSLKIGR
jgi:hypothetical protein